MPKPRILKVGLIDVIKSNSKFAFRLSHEEKLIPKKEVALLKRKNIVAQANVAKNNAFVAGSFTRSKNDGSKLMILNLKRLNKFIGYKHFKKESLENALALIRPGFYLTSTPVHQNHQVYLRFFVEEYLEFVCTPNE